MKKPYHCIRHPSSPSTISRKRSQEAYITVFCSKKRFKFKMTMTVSPLQPATSQQVRSKFFNMIGIEPSGKSPSSKQQEDSVACADRSKWVHPRIQQVNKSQASLKYDKRDDRIFSPKRSRRQESSPQSPSPKKQKKCISFDEDVSVIPIPMRTEYSCRVRQRMWSNANEIHQNAARNTVEFISEGYVTYLFAC
jgi:hypothetical protein